MMWRELTNGHTINIAWTLIQFSDVHVDTDEVVAASLYGNFFMH